MRRVLLAACGTIAGLIMLLSFKTHPIAPAGSRVATSGTTPDTASGASSGTPGATAGTPSGSAGTPAPTSGAAASATRTVDGSAADTRYGPVQVEITVANGHIASVNAIEYPTSKSRDQEINSYAIPQLNQEALAAKSAQIDMISGATYTSTGYITSLQSALTKAGLA